MEARDDGVKTLYKFMKYPADGSLPLENTEYRRRVEALLQDGELYFATASEFNDPFDSSPHFQLPHTIEEIIRSVQSGLQVYGRRNNMTQHQVDHRFKELERQIHSGEYQASIMQLKSSWLTMFKTQYPMCCLAAEKNNTLMWSYYADGHKGVCVHFDATQVPFGNAERINYECEYPTVLLPIADQEPKVFIGKALLTKSEEWKHEHEYRLVNMPIDGGDGATGHIFDGLFTWKSKQLAVIDTSYIEGVTVGTLMDGNEIEQILRICGNRKNKIPVFKANCKPDRFELEYERIS